MISSARHDAGRRVLDDETMPTSGAACGPLAYIRGRPDNALSEQLDCYCLPPRYREHLKIVPKLDAEVLAEIDIVAGTMTTLIYELLSCDKVVWVLDTEFRHLFDLVEEGLAHLVRLDDLRPPGQMPPVMLTRTCIPSETLFGTESLSDTLRDRVIGDSSPRMTPASMNRL